MTVLSVKDLRKRYGHVEALVGASLSINAGEVVSLIGDNGAGKSTLVRILSGVEAADSGHFEFDGKALDAGDISKRRELGIETVFQDLALADDLNPVQNLFLGREVMKPGILGKLGFMDTKYMEKQGRHALQSLAATVRNFTGRVGGMSGGQKQSIAVCRAATWANKLIFLDEPTAALGVPQTKGVMDLIRRIRDSGVAVILISHSMPHVLEISDRIVVLRRGRTVANYTPANTTVEELVGAMTGALEVGDKK
ncbi:ATP-binding cassette domain-containing protein [Paraburkholderia bannensis]|uniref:ATP-binding cassette domain-containing protein n=1 Tax=Paraburkholderia bannensis TaxID=765414 RepID=UPI002AC3367C|nr:ATP-binding cassette domain-containing protein [Paraburkholderia bannensis]